MDKVMQSNIATGLTIGSSITGATQSFQSGAFEQQQYLLQAEQAKQQGMADEINQNDRTIRAVAAIRAASASSGIADSGSGSTANAVLQAQAEGRWADIRARDNASTLSSQRIAQGTQARAAARTRGVNLLLNGATDVLKSGVLSVNRKS